MSLHVMREEQCSLCDVKEAQSKEGLVPDLANEGKLICPSCLMVRSLKEQMDLLVLKVAIREDLPVDWRSFATNADMAARWAEKGKGAGYAPAM